MRLFDYFEFGGILLSSGNRSDAYASAGLFRLPATFGCSCDTIDDGPYVSPVADPAPWVDGARAESTEFLGLLAHDIRLDSIAVRSVSPRSSAGATIGRLFLRHRIVSVRGLMLGQTWQGMAYGESWLRDVLAGRITGCAPDTVRVLLSCPEGAADPQYRNLARTGIVDGPNFGPVGELPECYIQEVQFQVAAGVPWLLHDEVECLAETTLGGGS